MTSVPEAIIVDPPPAEQEVVEIPRRPSTPPPDFVLSESLFNTLTEDFAQKTAPLNVEELEQLRATALDLIWRGRREWDRTGMMLELSDLVKDFVRDATMMEEDSNTGILASY